jgi:cytoskeleton protein RodZ
MAKQQEPPPIEEEPIEPENQTVGEQLRAAREKQDVSLDDVAARTRIPRRHLESIEQSGWDRLPAATYTIGFAKSYASVVGLDRSDIGDRLREEMGGHRFATTTPEIFEPADPRRAMPKGLVLGTILAVLVLIGVMTWLNKRSLEQPDQGNANSAPAATAAAAPTSAPVAQAPVQAAAAAQGPVVLTATAPAWIQITDQGKSLFAGQLAQGQSFTVPQTASAPLLKAGKPEALKVTVGNAVAPPVGPAGKVAANVSLLPADLMRGGSAAAAVPAAAPGNVTGQ